MRKNHLKNVLEYYPFRALIAVLKLLPYRLSKAFILGLFHWVGYGLGIRRKVASIQLRKVYPDWPQERINEVMKGLYRQMGLNIIEEYLMSDAELERISEIQGREYVDEALAMGRGAILATAHFGNWEAARILPLKGIPLSVITKKQRNTLFDDYTNAIRERSGLHVIDMKRGLRDIISDLKDNRMVAILADQNAGSHGLVLDFLSYPASHWKGVAKLSLRYQIPIVPGFVVRTKDDGLRFEFSPMIYHPDLEDKEENYEKVLSQIIAITERYIHKYPDHWFWVHKRWKHAYDMFQR
ncbi:MAG: lysophospholipid acyltransferase family protein [Candidatus Cloacimonetes bacterium]|mgnify:CR=1 FL=1|nr:lysophospholipid acyltransferase family protein [Candidatus Cloacimonadota bacterium]MDD2422958.1 lysophospholipid acyltransferase family protein [Candidatus Cloacimonadota bacterium]MDD3563411.1 lysophospholipid acyltransferase family protein [Candidatus Cloacimonadota bacterium]MDD4276927.1 lysophospholipid acyltransferase family protein [Candidatus Cloacimonadota bacterium]MDY0324911.1 lysophospholipid acyltransferase family protein [Candidatus Cloacimonadaceae bacterium]